MKSFYFILLTYWHLSNYPVTELPVLPDSVFHLFLTNHAFSSRYQVQIDVVYN